MTEAENQNTDQAAANANAQGGQDAAGGPAKEVHINIKVKAQDGTEIFFKIKRTT